MLRNLRSRRQPRYGAQICAVMSALLLLMSVALLYNRLSSSSSSHDRSYRHLRSQSKFRDEEEEENVVVGDSDSDSGSRIYQNFIVSDSDDNPNDVQDRIDELDIVEVKEENDDVILDGADQDLEQSSESYSKSRVSSSGYFMDHVTGSIRRSLSKRSIDQWDYDYNHDRISNSFGVGLGGGTEEDESKVSKAAFASDDIPVDEELRRKLNEVGGIEDALLLKIGRRASPLRQGWGDWFDKKSDFLRRDGMFKSSLEAMNPMNNALLQDPDGVGVTKLTRGDKAVQKLLLSEFNNCPFLAKKPDDQ